MRPQNIIFDISLCISANPEHLCLRRFVLHNILSLILMSLDFHINPLTWDYLQYYLHLMAEE